MDLFQFIYSTVIIYFVNLQESSCLSIFKISPHCQFGWVSLTSSTKKKVYLRHLQKSLEHTLKSVNHLIMEENLGFCNTMRR